MTSERLVAFFDTSLLQVSGEYEVCKDSALRGSCLRIGLALHKFTSEPGIVETQNIVKCRLYN